MKTLKINLKDKYGVVISSGARKCVPLLVSLKGAEKVLIVSDSTVYSLYGEQLKNDVKSTGVNVFTFTLPVGEGGKSKGEADKLLILMTQINLLKTDCVIALGGGTVSDLTGFACAMFKRGIPYINVPTTLLSMADASIGGKTAVDFLGEKNILGTVFQPKAVFCDTDYLKTLPKERFADGMVEIAKCAFICNKKMLEKIENEEYDIEKLIYFALKVKARLVEKDEFDNGIRHLLNFGHTFGHALECASGFNVSHGKAVAFGIMLASEFAERYGYGENVYASAQELFKKLKIDTKTPIRTEQLLPFIKTDKKREGEKVFMVLPKSVGKCKVKGVEFSTVEEFLSERKSFS